jgi:hypothetical protein
MSFPFALRKLLCLAHDLSCSCHFVSHFKVLCVLNQRRRYLLLRCLKAASLNALSRLL